MRDRDLVRLYWPVELRPAFDALFGIDDIFADIVMTSTQPALGAIRLAWWRETLERMDRTSPPPEPRLQAIATELIPRGIGGAMLASIEDGFAALFEEIPDQQRVGAGGAALFACGARLLGATDPHLADAGRLYALAQAHRRGALQGDLAVPTGLAGHRFSRRLRPLTVLACLAARDSKRAPAIEPEATPGRAAALLSHRLFGTIA